MSQASNYSIANATGAAVRSDLNDVFSAIVSQNSGATEPSVKYAYMWWADTSTTKLKIRNGANSGWIEVGTLDQTGLNIVASKFPNVTTNVTLTSAQLNNAVYLPSGTKMVFYQASAPTGWTKITSHNDKALRVVSGAGGSFGGTNNFSSTHTHSHGDTFSGGSTTLSTSQVPAHKHNFVNDDNIGSANLSSIGVTRVSSFGTGGSNGSGTLYKFTTDSVGGGGSHSHGISGSVSSTTISAYKYIDVIVCTKS